MARHKSRVTRRGRRKARAGTRKQSGGWLYGLFGTKNPDTNATDKAKAAAEAKAADEAKAAAEAKAADEAKAAADANAAAPLTTDTNAAPTQPSSFLSKFKFWGGGSRKKSRKTRHRRRRHHRK